MTSSPFNIRISNQECTGCRACEIACAFHHRRVFSRKMASLEVLRSEKDWKMSITRYLRDEKGHLACDYCEGEKEPLCVKYCARGAIIKE